MISELERKWRNQLLAAFNLKSLDVVLDPETYPNASDIFEQALFNVTNTIFRAGMKENIYKYSLQNQFDYICREKIEQMQNYLYPLPQVEEIYLEKICVNQVYYQLPVLAAAKDGTEIIFALPITVKEKEFVMIKETNWSQYFFTKDTIESWYNGIKFIKIMENQSLFLPMLAVLSVKKEESWTCQVNFSWAETRIEKITMVNIDNLNKIKNPDLESEKRKFFATISATLTPSKQEEQHDELNFAPRLPFAWKYLYDREELKTWGHRAGWSKVLLSLNQISKQDSEKKILLVDIIEKAFSWDYHGETETMKEIFFEDQLYQIPILSMKKRSHFSSEHMALLPNNKILFWNGSQWQEEKEITSDHYQKLPKIQEDQISEPYIGFWHNPPNAPLWFDYQHSPQEILKRSFTRKSLAACRGIFVLSEYFAKWLRSALSEIPELAKIPVEVLYHPTEFPQVQFNFDIFAQQEQKPLIQIGYWLRKMSFIAQIPEIPNYHKAWLFGIPYALNCLQRELSLEENQEINFENVSLMRLDNDEYDNLLSKSLVVLYLYDTSVNNTVIECISRGTPLLINRHPAISEYLGEDYPLFYDNMDDLVQKAQDMTLIKAAHEHLLKEEIRDRIRYIRFVDDFCQSEIIRDLIRDTC